MSEIDENVLVTGCEQALASFAPEISEVLTPHNPNLQNWMGPSESSRTAPNLTAGIQSLQNLGGHSSHDYYVFACASNHAYMLAHVHAIFLHALAHITAL